eukprot:NODE_2025_length_667_cov_489.135922_g1583_i1.p1 GENE.NODE_2025_length_667_cov_489.135922_g1583_i1~~NODE_2025_length_667_cov_489.135922_g1583_i1.p1  ORF type:complete len:162 (-),score=38.92 NODE_2025_length_667_cov_489.135922_g1583_i1:122-607(-)
MSRFILALLIAQLAVSLAEKCQCELREYDESECDEGLERRANVCVDTDTNDPINTCTKLEIAGNDVLGNQLDIEAIRIKSSCTTGEVEFFDDDGTAGICLNSIDTKPVAGAQCISRHSQGFWFNCIPKADCVASIFSVDAAFFSGPSVVVCAIAAILACVF